MRVRVPGVYGVLPLILAASAAAGVIPVGQIDTFEDGTLMGWTSQAIRQVASGGPAGVDDHYLRIDSDNWHWGAHNHAQWGGNAFAGEIPDDYATNDITAIAMDLANFGPDPLDVRILFTPNSSSRHATRSVHLEPDSGWVHVYFGILPHELIRVEGSGSASTVRNAVNRIAIKHDPDPADGHGEGITVNAVGGIDNIEAIGTRLQGDANFDGAVNLADFVILKNHFGSDDAWWMDADFTGDGKVDLADFARLHTHFGSRASTVPEPTSLALLALAGVAYGRRRI